MEIKITIGATPELNETLRQIATAMTTRNMPSIIDSIGDALVKQRTPRPEYPSGTPEILSGMTSADFMAATDDVVTPEPSEDQTSTPVVETAATDAKSGRKPYGPRKPKPIIENDEPKPTAASRRKPAVVVESNDDGVDDLTGAANSNGHAKELTVDDLIAATQNAVFRNANNRDPIRQYLDDADVAKVTELSPDVWPAFIQFADKLK